MNGRVKQTIKMMTTYLKLHKHYYNLIKETYLAPGKNKEYRRKSGNESEESIDEWQRETDDQDGGHIFNALQETIKRTNFILKNSNYLAPGKNEEYRCKSGNESEESIDERQCEADNQDDGHEESGNEDDVIG